MHRRRRIGLIPSTRPETVVHAVNSLTDCDQVLVRHDREREGECVTRNHLLDDVSRLVDIRFCDDDDLALPVMQAIPADADVLAFGYMVGSSVVQPPENVIQAAVNSVINGNWIARRQSLERVRDMFGTFYDPAWTMNTGTRFWLRMIDAGLRFAFVSRLIGYEWCPSRRMKHDPELYEDLIRRGGQGVGQRIEWDHRYTQEA